MKFVLALATLALSLSASAQAASSKICFGTGTDKGSRFEVALTKKTASITKAVGGDFQNEDSKLSANGSVAGRDGKNYISYAVSSEEGSTDLLVDDELLQDGTKGLVKVRWRGESFSQTTYLCKDAQ